MTAYGFSWTRIPGAASPPPPPPGPTFDNITINWLSGESNMIFVGQMYYGVSTANGGFSTNKTTFLAAHPGLTLLDFSGIAAPGGTAAAPSFTGFTVVPDVSKLVYDSAAMTPTAPFCALGMTTNTAIFTFSPEVSAVGFQLAQHVAAADVSIFYAKGVTLLDSEFVNPGGTGTFTDFYGYAT